MEKEFDPRIVCMYWLTEANEALQVAEHLMEKGDFSYALFFGHLALEKILKSLYVHRVKNHAPLMHNLNRLAAESGLILNDKQTEVLTAASTYNIESRYPDIQRSFRTLCTMEFAAAQMKQVKEMFQWLRTQIPLK